MNKINTANIYNTSFQGTNKDKNKMLDNNTLMNMLLDKCKELLSSSAERKVPENGQFSIVHITFNVPNSNNQGILSINCDSIDPKTQRRLSVGVHHKNSDRLVSTQLLKGTKNEILDYLNSKDNTQKIVDIVTDLSNETDNYYSSL